MKHILMLSALRHGIKIDTVMDGNYCNVNHMNARMSKGAAEVRSEKRRKNFLFL